MRNSRFYTLAATFLACLFFLLVGISLYFQVQDVKAERRGCERLDVVRNTVYLVLTQAADAQLKDLELARTPKQRQAQIDSARQFRSLTTGLVASIRPPTALIASDDAMPRDGLPDEIHVDCTIAYPYPFGL